MYINREANARITVTISRIFFFRGSATRTEIESETQILSEKNSKFHFEKI
jgi:hypothetical protein